MDFDGPGNTDLIYHELTEIQQVPEAYAAKTCRELSVESGCDWYLPALGELKALHDQLSNTPEKREANGFIGNVYWSSTEGGMEAWTHYFNQPKLFQLTTKSNPYISTRCVRR